MKDIFWNIFNGCILGTLEGADVEDDGPAFFRRKFIGIGAHLAFTVGDCLEYFTYRHFTETVVVVGSGGDHAIFFSYTVTVTGSAVTGGAEDGEFVLAELH